MLWQAWHRNVLHPLHPQGAWTKISVCVCARESVRPRQHVTKPTGVAETRFDEDPEAEEAAAANADDSDVTTPTKSAPDSSLPDAIKGMCLLG